MLTMHILENLNFSNLVYNVVILNKTNILKKSNSSYLI